MTGDRLGRPLRSLRLSVTDRCNLRCAYCMPEEQYTWLPNPEILSFEELDLLVDRFITQGVRKVRVTGGEPLVRRELSTLIARLARKPLDELALTTNGVLLEAHLPSLVDAGLRQLTVSLDTLRPERFRALTRRDLHAQVLAGIEAASRTRLGRGLKLDAVVLRGLNDDELVPLLDYATRVGAELRFIEYMDVGGATKWAPERVVTGAQLLEVLTRALGKPTALAGRGSAPAQRYRLPDGRTFGLITSTTQPFCRSCDRARLTADGHWYTCLYATTGVDLKRALREGQGAEALEALIAQTWSARSDRGAEQRLALRGARGPSAEALALRHDPHLEMHTRGG
jgi:cyclic pyranopterin phosphate synthase